MQFELNRYSWPVRSTWWAHIIKKDLRLRVREIYYIQLFQERKVLKCVDKNALALQLYHPQNTSDFSNFTFTHVKQISRALWRQCTESVWITLG